MNFTQDASTDLGSDGSDLGLQHEDTTRLTVPATDENHEMEISLQASLADPDRVLVCKWAARLELESLTMKRATTEEFKMAAIGIEEMNVRLDALEGQVERLGTQLRLLFRTGNIAPGITRLERLLREKTGSRDSQRGNNTDILLRISKMELLLHESINRLEDQHRLHIDPVQEVLQVCLGIKQGIAEKPFLEINNRSSGSELAALRSEMGDLRALIREMLHSMPNKTTISAPSHLQEPEEPERELSRLKKPARIDSEKNLRAKNGRFLPRK